MPESKFKRHYYENVSNHQKTLSVSIDIISYNYVN